MRQVIVAFLLMAALCPLGGAQIPEMQSPSWDLGWEEEDEPAIMELDNRLNFILKIKFWIDNSRPIPGEFEVEVETYDGFEVDDPGKVDVAANSNETFEITISGSGELNGELHDATGAYFDIVKLTATLDIGDQVIDSKEIEKQLQFSSVYGFEVEIQPIVNGLGPEVKSGTSESIDVTITNSGNVNDALSKIEMSFRGCPQMNYDASDSGIEQGTAISDSKSGSILLSAPTNHPDRTCKFIITVTSEGNGFVYTGEVEFEVDGNSNSQSDNSQQESDDNSPTQNSNGLEVEDNSLTAHSFLFCVIIVIIAAVFRQNRVNY